MPLWMVDTSVWARTDSSEAIRGRVIEIVEAESAATCVPVMLEVFYSARNQDEYSRRRTEFAALHQIHINRNIERRALYTQERLVGAGQHRGIGRTDLLAAACAEAAGAILLHYDRDYERIASVMGQEAEWVVDPGEV